MPDEFFFLTFGGLGVSLAGFAGLIHALDRSDSADNPETKWRIRNIVMGGFTVALAGLLTWPVYGFTQDVDTTVRIVSAYFVLGLIRQFAVDARPGPAWPNDTRRKVFLGIGVALGVVAVINVFAASVALLELLFFLAIGGPIGTFIRAIGDLHDPAEASA